MNQVVDYTLLHIGLRRRACACVGEARVSRCGYSCSCISASMPQLREAAVRVDSHCTTSDSAPARYLLLRALGLTTDAALTPCTDFAEMRCAKPSAPCSCVQIVEVHGFFNDGLVARSWAWRGNSTEASPAQTPTAGRPSGPPSASLRRGRRSHRCAMSKSPGLGALQNPSGKY